MNKFPRNHRLGLTQTLAKSDHSQEQKRGKNSEQKSQLQLRNLGGQLE
jgi:hypothetical protein